MFSFRKHYRILPVQGRRVLWSLVTVAVALGIFSSQVVSELLHARNAGEVIANGLPPALCLLCIIGIGLTLRGRFIQGVILLIAGLWFGMLMVPTLASGYGFIAGVIAFLIPAYLLGLIFETRWLGFSQMASMFVGMAIILMDAFWPGQRIPQDSADVNAATIIALVLLAVYIVFTAQRFPAYSLRTKLVMSFIAVAILPMGLVAVINNRATTAALTQDAQHSLLYAASAAAARMDTFIQSNLDELQTEASYPDFIEYLKLPPDRRAGSEAEAKVRSIINILRRKDLINITSYALLDAMGRNVADSNTEEANTDEAGMYYFQQPLLTKRPFVSPVLVSSDNSGESLVFSAPVRNELGESIGVLRARYNADVLQQLIVRISQSLDARSSILLIDDDHILLGHSSESGYLYKSIVPLDVSMASALQKDLRLPSLPAAELSVDLPNLAQGLQAMTEKPNFEAATHQGVGTEGIEQAGAVKLANKPWSIVVVRPRELLLAPVERQARNTLVLGVGITMLAVAVGSMLAQILSRPIMQLTTAARRIAQGEMGEPVAVKSQDEIGVLATTFNTMMDQIKNLITTLEQRVSERTRALQTSAEVSRRLSTVLDQDRLVKDVVDQVQAAFGYYHAHIYLFDDQGETLVLAGGTGDAGRAMLGRGHKIARGRGLVGRAAEKNQPVLVGDVTSDPHWLPNPLLPETRSEVAVPIAIGSQVLGVLDVQQNSPDGLGKTDVDLLQSIANQVAIAIQNARAFSQAQRQAERETWLASIGQRIQSANTVDDVMRIAVNELGQALNAKRARAELGKPRQAPAHATYEELG